MMSSAIEESFGPFTYTPHPLSATGPGAEPDAEEAALRRRLEEGDDYINDTMRALAAHLCERGRTAAPVPGLEPEAAGRVFDPRSVAGTVKVEFVRRLHRDWRNLADVLEVPLAAQRCFFLGACDCVRRLVSHDRTPAPWEHRSDRHPTACRSSVLSAQK